MLPISMVRILRKSLGSSLAGLKASQSINHFLLPSLVDGWSRHLFVYLAVLVLISVACMSTYGVMPCMSFLPFLALEAG